MSRATRERARERRERDLRQLADNLTALDPTIHDSFRCPICPRVITLKKDARSPKRLITEAHIVPKAAEGRQTTYACDDCNSKCGEAQDAWFGEWVRLARDGPPNVLASRRQPKSFLVDDLRVQGEVTLTPDNDIEVLIDGRRNSPAMNRLVKEKFDNRPKKIAITLAPPIMKQERMIKVGFLTAAYLAWFKAFGYSWVFQDHLDPVRQQILNPSESIYEFTVPDLKDPTPWKEMQVGILRTEGGTVMLAAGLLDRLVLLPPVDRPDTRRVQEDDKRVRLFTFETIAPPGPPTMLLFEDRALIAPEPCRDGRVEPVIVFYAPGLSSSRQLHRVTAEEAAALAAEPDVVRLRVNLRRPPAGSSPEPT